MKAVNLLPPDTRGAARAPAEQSVSVADSSNTGVYAILGGLAVAVACVAGVVLAGNAVKDREAQLSAVAVQQQQLAGRAAALKPYADFDQLASERVSTVRDIAGRRFDWEQALRDLSRTLPADVTLSEISGNVSTDAGGGTSSPLRGAISAPAITLVGCTANQRSVARLMARLRNVDGVTRVSLSKSTKSDLSSGAGAAVGSGDPGATTASALAARIAAPCGQGNRPQFEVVIFFEGDADAATAPSATPPAAGAAGAPGQPAAATPTATPAAGGTSPTSTSAQPQATPTPTTQAGVSP